jgi:hypothetical protein
MSWATDEISSRVNPREQEAILSLLELQEKGADVRERKKGRRRWLHIGRHKYIAQRANIATARERCTHK